MCRVYCCGFPNMHLRCLRAWLLGGQNRGCPMCRQTPTVCHPFIQRVLPWAVALWCAREHWLAPLLGWVKS